jgi:hypothetical protein
MTNTDSKLAEITRITSTWLEPDSDLTSYQAMMAIMDTLEETPRDQRRQSADGRWAEARRWEQDRPVSLPPRPVVGRQPKRAIRAKSSFLG